MRDYAEMLGVAGAVLMPVWNIPLMWRIYKRRSADDISLGWLFGIWGCLLLMLPSSLETTNIVLKSYGVANLAMFTFVVIVVLKYRNRR